MESLTISINNMTVKLQAKFRNITTRHNHIRDDLPYRNFRARSRLYEYFESIKGRQYQLLSRDVKVVFTRQIRTSLIGKCQVN